MPTSYSKWIVVICFSILGIIGVLLAVVPWWAWALTTTGLMIAGAYYRFKGKVFDEWLVPLIVLTIVFLLISLGAGGGYNFYTEQ